MKIKTTARLATTLTISVVLMYAAFALIINRSVGSKYRDFKTASDTQTLVNRLRSLTSDYVIYQTERARQQWWTVQGELLAKLNSPEYQVIQKNYHLEDFQAQLQLMGEAFTKLIEAGETGLPAPEAAIHQEFRNRLITQIEITFREIVKSLSGIRDQIGEVVVSLQLRGTWADGMALLILIAFILANSLFLQRSVVQPVLQLHGSARIIGEGNLDHRVAPAAGSGEIRELLQTFNEMTANLQDVTVSREELIREMEERRRAEEALRQSEEQLRLAQTAAQVGVWEWQPQKQILQLTPELEKLYGLQPGAIKHYHDWSRLVHPEDLPRIEAERDAAIIGHLPFDSEFRILHVSGQIRWVQAKGGAFYSDDGIPLRVFGINLDITQRKQTEEALQEALARAEAGDSLLSALMEYVPEGITIADKSGRLRMVSRYGQELLGGLFSSKTTEEVINERAVYQPDGKTPIALGDLPLMKVLQTGEAVWNQEIIQVNNKGEKLSLLCNAAPIRNPEGSIIGSIVAWRDITERKQAAEALRKSEERVLLAIRASSIGFFEWNVSQDTIYWSPEMYKLFGQEPQAEATYERWFGCVHPADREPLAKITAELRERARCQEIIPARRDEYRVVHDDGAVVWLESTTLFEYDNGSLVMRGAVRDITTRQEAEEALRRSHDELEQRVSARTKELHQAVVKLLEEISQRQKTEEALRESQEQLRLLANQLINAQEMERGRLSRDIHDDFGQSLMVLHMQLNAILKKNSLAPEIRPHLEKVVSYLLEVTEKVRRFSQDLSPPSLERLGLTEALRELFEDFQELYDNRGMIITVDLDEIKDILPKESNIVIYRISQEFLTNTYKHSNATKMSMAMKVLPDKVAITLEDNGQGFDLDEIKNRPKESRGLGLASIEERLKMIGSHFSLSSRAGLGTTLHFEILRPTK